VTADEWADSVGRTKWMPAQRTVGCRAIGAGPRSPAPPHFSFLHAVLTKDEKEALWRPFDIRSRYSLLAQSGIEQMGEPDTRFSAIAPG
jgi:hypothetical protein